MTITTAPPDELLVDSANGICQLTLNRPGKRNALSASLLSSLAKQLALLANDDQTRVVVLAAAGPVFCSGHDLGEMIGRDESYYRSLFELCSGMMQMLRKLPQPVIAKVQGPATAAGCQLVAACDLAVAVESATFATPGVKIGLFCTTPMVPLVRVVPPRAAMEMLLTGKPISAQQALDWGLVNRVVPADALDDTVNELASAIASASPLTVKIGKQAFYHGLTLDEAEAYTAANATMTDNALKHDAQEGMSAFLQKRMPKWTGE